jgi:hypothetical protein
MNCIGLVLDGDQYVGDIGRYSRPTQIISVHKRNFRSGGDGSNPKPNQNVFWYWFRSHEWRYSKASIENRKGPEPREKGIAGHYQEVTYVHSGQEKRKAQQYSYSATIRSPQYELR